MSLKERWRLIVEGKVQGVGFRPFVYRLAHKLEIVGWVKNGSKGVTIEIEGKKEQCKIFHQQLKDQLPPLAFIAKLNLQQLKPLREKDFVILPSDQENKTAWILPDIATCDLCCHEIFDPSNRRYQYPFTNCTNCGPRFSIIQKLPYDRCFTTMKDFKLCNQCSEEMENPLERRFHAQPNTCPECGPHLELWNIDGDIIALKDKAIEQTAIAIGEGKIIAIKGLGGFHIVVDARNYGAIQKLRHRKKRHAKAFALMYPSIDNIEDDCIVDDLEKKWLLAKEAPIVLVKAKVRSCLAKNVAPQNPYLGIMLPYTPLHHILMKKLNYPIVATSGNLSDEPICIDEREALIRLKDIADLFLVHNRPIAQRIDDSILRVVNNREMVLRRARGFAPLPINLSITKNVLAVGGYLKNTIALSQPGKAFLSQHIGDLDVEKTMQSFTETISFFTDIYKVKPEIIAYDLHPDYPSTKYAYSKKIRGVAVQHHYAHILSCMVEHNISSPVLGVAWDGTGYGLDHHIWGGEFLEISKNSFDRFAYLRPFRLPGGERAIQDPKRVVFALLYEIFGTIDFTSLSYLEKLYTETEKKIFATMLDKGINSPYSTSIGRLFDAVALLLGVCYKIEFEGQAAMGLEFIAETVSIEEEYSFGFRENLQIDWQPLLKSILRDIGAIPPEIIAAKFHNTLVEIIVQVAQKTSYKTVVVSGGCFQNKLLLEKTIKKLRQNGYNIYWPREIPPNDGGIALGQIAAAMRMEG